MEAKTNPTAIDLLNLEHAFMSLKEALVHDYRWGTIRPMLEALCSYRDKVTIRFVGDDAVSRLEDLKHSYWEDGKYLEASHIADLHALVNRWLGRIDLVAQKWVLYIPQAHLDTAKLAAGLRHFWMKMNMPRLARWSNKD